METLPEDDASVYSDESGFEGDDDVRHNGNKGKKKTEERQQVERMTLKDTRNMRVWKTIVFTFLFCSACVVSTGTYFFVKKTETEEFEHTYDQFADTIKEALRFHIAGLTESLQAHAQWMVAEAAQRNQTFPAVTIGSFEVEGMSVRVASKIHGVVFTPLLYSNGDMQAWNGYSAQEQDWIVSSRKVFEASPDAMEDSFQNPIDQLSPVKPYISGFPHGAPVTTLPLDGTPVAPWWQQSPPPYDAATKVNANVLEDPEVRTLYQAMVQAREAIFGPVSTLDLFSQGFAKTATETKRRDGDQLYGDDSFAKAHGDDSGGHHRVLEEDRYHPMSVFMQPVFADLFDTNSPLVGVLHAAVRWDSYVVNLLPQGVNGIRVVMRNDCGDPHTYEVNGPNAVYIGQGELRAPKYENKHFRVDLPFHKLRFPETTPSIEGHCSYSFSIYPSEEFESEYRTPLPFVLTLFVGAAFMLMVSTFFAYDFFVNRRNRKIVDAAAKFNFIVSSLFPENVRERLFADAEEKMRKKEKVNAVKNIDEFMVDDDSSSGTGEEDTPGKPIADLFPETSILFADIAGFTAWSSTREPVQVFQLLGAIYSCFDKIAERRGVYKVETIGDCYVAVVGLPKPNPDHAVVMSKFAREAMNKFRLIVRKLEVTLGPDTSTLAMRAGIHSGPVTAGVLSGERSRFQLFGDTMNTASRMESTGVRDKIQLSQETAELLYAHGKSRWVTPREERVIAKGKGELQTYWLSCAPASTGTIFTGTTTEDSESLWAGDVDPTPGLPEKVVRSIQWNVDILGKLIREIAANRESYNNAEPLAEMPSPDGTTVVNEISDAIPFVAPLDTAIALRKSGTSLADVNIDQAVFDQLHDLITAIALLYHSNNAFHNFDHASHFTMSVVKLVSRTDDDNDVSFGIRKDPMVQFALILSSLIHDIDHPGVPNQTLIREQPALAKHYNNRSVAEQQSFDLATRLLMEERYSDLRQALYQTEQEALRFRQILVNAVMATDLLDPELQAWRTNRWVQAFSQDSTTEGTIQRKTTMVIEIIMQASDVAHTIQHWHIYRKWNDLLYAEAFQAYRAGRSDRNPADYWYDGEISFFNTTVIPLAQKIKDCGVFCSSSSDEFLKYALNNKKEWMAKGRALVAELAEKCSQEGSTTDS
mmetsp:Transcript_7886/g.15271  ORF Transcript_7886/g.15271 Transcript_7886/m.15271 type:complete len:1152 (-) Transcript_7886:303-3758(-)